MQTLPFIRRLAFAFAATCAIAIPAHSGEMSVTDGYTKLLQLHQEWRAFERPPFVDGAPDYTAATFARRHQELAGYRQRLAAIDTANWPVEHRIDHELLRAEMNGFDFYVRVLQPWARDPAFYQSIWNDQSDTPAHEGSEHHGIVEVWTYEFPLSKAAEAKLAGELAIVPPLLKQADGNLTGNARDLWVTGAGSMRKQVDVARRAGEAHVRQRPSRCSRRSAPRREATVKFCDWLDAQAPSKTGPSGIGKENYTWSLQQRPPRADDLGGGSGAAASASSRAPMPRSSSKRRAMPGCRSCR